MEDWTDNASQELKELIDDAMDQGIHEDFASFYDFLRACVNQYEENNAD